MMPYELNPIQNEKGDFEIRDKHTDIVLAVRPRNGTLYDSVRYHCQIVLKQSSVADIINKGLLNGRMEINKS